MTQPLYVLSEDSANFTITYHVDDAAKRTFLQNQWKSFNRYDPALARSYKILCRPTNPNMEVTVERYMPAKSPAGKYRVEVFVPAIHAQTRKAIFTITYNVLRVNGEVSEEYSLVVVDMSELHDEWHPLGEFQLDPSLGREIGKVRQYDLSLEDPPVEAAFGPVRWVPLFSSSGKKARFDAPVGTKEERAEPFPTGRVMFGKYPVWVGNWYDANPFLTWYTYGYHTGADLNLPGSSQADKGKEIYSIGDGIVTYAGRAGTWGNIIVISHPEARVTLPNGNIQKQGVYSRYGHVDDRIMVKAGQSVKRGQLIGYIGLALNAVSGWHLHFDICYSDMLAKRPAHWPNIDTIRALRFYNKEEVTRSYASAQLNVKKQVLEHYLNPLTFLRDNH